MDSQLLRLICFKDINLRLFGRIWSFSQPWRSHNWSFSRNPTDSWTLTKFLQWERYNFFRLGVQNSGNSVMDSQLLRLIYFKDINLRLFGRIWSFSQPSRSHNWSFSRNPIDSWTLTKFLQWKRHNFSRPGVQNSGNSVMDSQLLRLIYFKYFSWIPCRRKKKNHPTFK